MNNLFNVYQIKQAQENLESLVENQYQDDVSVKSSSIFSNGPSTKESDIGDDIDTDSKARYYLSDANTNIQYVSKKRAIIVPRNNFEILKHGYDLYSQVYALQASYLLDCIKHQISKNEIIVIKIHDVRHYPDENFYVVYDRYDEEMRKQELFNKKVLTCKENYDFERRCYSILENDPHYNSIAYDQEELDLIFCCAGGFYRRGMTNIFKYIETQTMPRDLETYRKVLEQLEINT